MAIPKVFIKEGVQATQAAKEAVAKISKATKKEVITTEKLLRSPASDLFEKKGIMEAEAFWHEPQNFANYARGQYLTEGGQALQLSHKIENKVISNSDNLERGLYHYSGQPLDCVTYYEKNLLTGKSREIELYNGYPYRSVGKKGCVEILYNMETGAPGLQREFLKDAKGKLIGTEHTRFGKDGKTIISSETELYDSPFSRIVREYAPDGSYTVKRYAKDNGKPLVSIEKYSKDDKCIREIKLHKGTKKPQQIEEYDNQGNWSKTQHFDIQGNLTNEY